MVAVVCCLQASVSSCEVVVWMYCAWRGCDRVGVKLVEFLVVVVTDRSKRPVLC